MKFRLLLFLCCVSYSPTRVYGESDNEVKRGIYPYMAFVYYPDETVLDITNTRFLRSAVLIRPNWLLTTAIDHVAIDNEILGFPKKTLLARAGAVSIDTNFTLNEDEDEQEREIIQIVRPNTHNREKWWVTDISLLLTLLPFKMTSAVAAISINPKREYNEKNCAILVYAKRMNLSNSSEEKSLMQLSVELLPPSADNCGSQFNENSMTCATDSEETKNTIYDPDFCVGNSGGPLICENDVVGLQTYIDNNCKQPHLYQLLSARENFISCVVESKCNSDPNCNICFIINKDSPAPSPALSLQDMPTTSTTKATTVPEASASTMPDTTIIETTIAPTNEPTVTVTETAEDTETTTQTLVVTHSSTPTETETPTPSSELREILRDVAQLPVVVHSETSSPSTPKATPDGTTIEVEISRSWPLERTGDPKKMEQNEDVTRRTNMEAQLKSEGPSSSTPIPAHTIPAPVAPAYDESKGNSFMILPQTVFIYSAILAYLFA